MEKSIFEQVGGNYYQQGDYLLPNLIVPANASIGVWGQRHLRYIRAHRKGLYAGLQLDGKLNSYLADIDQQPQDMLSRLVKQMADTEGITEQLKSENQMEWVRQMNNIVNRAMEVIASELIYT